MYFALSNWCNRSKIAYLYSFQFLVVHAYCWAIPDRRYFQYVHDHQNIFWTLVSFNSIGYLAGIIGGLACFYSSLDGLAQIWGFSMACYQFVVCTPLMICSGNAVLEMRRLYSE